MFLKDIENRPAGGMTKIAFKTLRDTGEAVPDILHLFRFKTRSTDHLVRFTEEVMRGPSPLSPGIRELIGAFISRKNQCSFCSDAHAAAASQFLEPDLVDEVLSNFENSRLDLPHKELFRYLSKLAGNASRVSASDIARLKAVGWSEEAIYDALTVASVFQFYNTWNGGSGVQAMRSTDYVYSGKVLDTLGYCMDFKWKRLIKLSVTRFFSLIRVVFLARRDKDRRPADPWAEPTPPQRTSA